MITVREVHLQLQKLGFVDNVAIYDNEPLSYNGFNIENGRSIQFLNQNKKWKFSWYRNKFHRWNDNIGWTEIDTDITDVAQLIALYK